MTSTVRPLWTALGAAVLLMVLLLTGAAWLDHRQFHASAEADARGMLRTLRAQVIEVLESADQLAREVDRRTAGITWTDMHTNHAVLADDLRALIGRREYVSAIGLADAAGQEWLIPAAGANDLGVNDPSLSGERDVRQQEFWTSLHNTDQDSVVSRADMDNGSSRATLAISRRRTSPDSGFGGAIQVFMPVAYFTRLWETTLPAQAGATVSLLRNDGATLAVSPAVPASRQSEPYAVAERADFVQVSSRVPVYDLVITLASPISPMADRWVQRLIFPGVVCLLAATALGGALASILRQARMLAEQQSCRIAAEEAALAGQKLEILGQLAAGVGHDFANVMQAITAGANAITCMSQDERVTQIAGRLREAAAHGHLLTHRMLDFARDRVSSEATGTDRIMRPMETVTETCALLSDILGGGYQIRCEIDPTGLPDFVRGQRSGLASAIMNLAVNARDAMAGGGEIVIRLAAERVPLHAGRQEPGRPPQQPALPAGLYARIAVADSGTGMPPAVLARATEPFFTTKPRGQGTGLGLAGVRAFAVGAGGGFHIQSVENAGTTVTIWLPEAALPQSDGADIPPPIQDQHANR